MEEALENRDFQISTVIFAAMLANPKGEHHQRRQSSSNEAPAVASHPAKPAPPLGIALRVDHPQQGLANGLHPGEFEYAAFEAAYSVCPEILSVDQRWHAHRDDDRRRYRRQGAAAGRSSFPLQDARGKCALPASPSHASAERLFRHRKRAGPIFQHRYDCSSSGANIHSGRCNNRRDPRGLPRFVLAGYRARHGRHEARRFEGTPPRGFEGTPQEMVIKGSSMPDQRAAKVATTGAWSELGWARRALGLVAIDES